MTKALKLDEYPFQVKIMNGKKVAILKDTIDDVPGSRDFLKTKRIDKNQEIIIDSRISGKVISLLGSADIVIEHAWKTLRSGKPVMVRTGGAGELNGNDMRKINIAVKAASANPDGKDKIRNDLLREYIAKAPKPTTQDGGFRRSAEEKAILFGTSSWARNPNSFEAGYMAVSNNVMKGRDRHAGLSKYQLQEITRYEEAYGALPHKDLLKAINVKAQFNRRMAQENIGKGQPITVYRGIYGKQAEAIKTKAKRGDTIRINANSLQSWTTDKRVADDFMTGLGVSTKRGVVIKATISHKRVFDSWASTNALDSFGPQKINEIVVTPKGLRMTGVIIND